MSKVTGSETALPSTKLRNTMRLGYQIHGWMWKLGLGTESTNLVKTNIMSWIIVPVT